MLQGNRPMHKRCIAASHAQTISNTTMYKQYLAPLRAQTMYSPCTNKTQHPVVHKTSSTLLCANDMQHPPVQKQHMASFRLSQYTPVYKHIEHAPVCKRYKALSCVPTICSVLLYKNNIHHPVHKQCIGCTVYMIDSTRLCINHTAPSCVQKIHNTLPCASDTQNPIWMSKSLMALRSNSVPFPSPHGHGPSCNTTCFAILAGHAN